MTGCNRDKSGRFEITAMSPGATKVFCDYLWALRLNPARIIPAVPLGTDFNFSVLSKLPNVDTVDFESSGTVHKNKHCSTRFVVQPIINSKNQNKFIYFRKTELRREVHEVAERLGFRDFFPPQRLNSVHSTYVFHSS